MPRTVTTDVYQYDELSEAAQAKARDWYRQGDNDIDLDHVIDDAVRMAGILGITVDTHTVRLMGGGTRQEPSVYYQLFSQGAGASFGGRYAYRKGALKAIKREAPQDTELHRIAADLQDIQNRHFYRVSAVFAPRGNSLHEHSVMFDVFIGDDDANEATSEVIADTLRDFMRWIHRNLEREYEYQNEDEVVAENIRANEYEFTEDGRRA